jgi:citrate lyase subunit beta/citryl-CoA lyase
MASVNMRSLNVGTQPLGYTEGDAYHYALMKLLVAGRAFGKQVIDGPYLEIKDLVGLALSSNRSAALGFDGKWVLHPDQIDLVNEIFSPTQEEFEQAELILQAYEYHTSQKGGQLGAVMLGSQMIDEASRKMALVVSAKGRAAGLVSDQQFEVGK